MVQTTDNQKELFIVVNENDDVIGYRSRFDCHHDKTLLHRAVNVALFNTKGEIAFQKRSRTKDLYPSYYTLSATGHVSKGESYRQAAIREMEEELGVGNIALDLISTQMVNAPQEREMVALFKGVYDGVFHYFTQEVASIHWLKKEEIAKIKDNITPCSYNSLKILGII